MKIIKKNRAILSGIHVKSIIFGNEKWFNANDLIVVLKKKKIKWSIAWK